MAADAPTASTAASSDKIKQLENFSKELGFNTVKRLSTGKKDKFTFNGFRSLKW